MRKFEITATNDGQYQLLEIRPVLIGVFPEQATAKTVRDLLDAASRDDDEDIPSPIVAASESPQQPTRKQDRLQPPDFTAAVARIEKGEKIAAVADDIGAPFAGLRAAWANHCRQKKAAERKTAPALSRPTLPAPAKVECVLCSREFTPSESSPDKCARCAGEFQ